jgi:hypothetical protein
MPEGWPERRYERWRGRSFALGCAAAFLSVAALPQPLSSQTASNATATHGAKSSPAAAANGAAGMPAGSSEIPHLRKQGTASQLIVDGKPFLVLAGELNNDSSSSLEYMKAVWPKLVTAKLNTVLTPVSWAQIEPQEGKFDFSVLDGMIREARVRNLHLALLWFASWKNGLSSYPPDWVKKDFERFPRAQIQGGRSIELLTPLSDANRDADAHAFAALMWHVKETDGRQHTVIMIQVENEIGFQRDSRDRSPAANEAFEGQVPKELMDTLARQKETLIPEFRRVWEGAGGKTSGTWQEVFGRGEATDEIFMAWYFARYIGGVVDAGKAEYPIPMFLNVAVGNAVKKHDPAKTLTEERKALRKRYFAVGGPMDDLMDVWRAGAPKIDMLSPDAYSDFAEWAAGYDRSGNPLFIPENVGGTVGARRVLFAFGRHNAVGFSAMGAVERSLTPDTDLIGSYELIDQMAPLIAKHEGDGMMSGFLLGPDNAPQKATVGNYTVEAAFLRPPPVPMALPTEIPPFTYGAAIVIATGPDEFVAAGNGVILTFSPNTAGPPRAGLASVEEGVFVDGRWVPGRRLAGDDTAEGDGLMLRWPPGSWAPSSRQRKSATAIQRATLYRFR